MGRVSLPQGPGSQMHNRRDYERYGKAIPANINQDRTHLNVTIVDKDIHEAYREIFGDAVAAYNARQKRADRKIDDYCDYITKSKNGENLFYEDVLQWGNKDDFAAHPEYWNVAKSALVKYAETFEERNPNLRLIGAYIHMDERSPHLHFDYIPVATGYKKGLALRNSLEKAMRQMGYVPEPGKESRKNNATKLWKENERAYFAEICQSLGLEVEPEQPGRGKNLSVAEYGAARDKMIADLNEEMKPLKEQAQSEIDAANAAAAAARDAADQAAKETRQAQEAAKKVQGQQKAVEEKRDAAVQELRQVKLTNAAVADFESIGEPKKTLTGKVTGYFITPEQRTSLISWAQKGVASTTIISDLQRQVDAKSRDYYYLSESHKALQGKYDRLREQCKVWLDFCRQVPEQVVEKAIGYIRSLMPIKQREQHERSHQVHDRDSRGER